MALAPGQADSLTQRRGEWRGVGMGTDHSVTASLVSFPLGAGTGETGTLSPHLVALCVLSKPQALGKGEPLKSSLEGSQNKGAAAELPDRSTGTFGGSCESPGTKDGASPVGSPAVLPLAGGTAAPRWHLPVTSLSPPRPRQEQGTRLGLSPGAGRGRCRGPPPAPPPPLKRVPALLQLGGLRAGKLQRGAVCV